MTDATLPADAAPGTPAAEARPEPFLSRVLNTFVAPLPMFRRFGERPPWVDVLVLSGLLTALAFFLLPAEVWREAAADAARQNPQMAGADSEQMAGFQRIVSVVMGFVMPWIGVLITAAIATFLFSVVMGGNARFRQYLSVVAHAGLIGAVGTLATLPVMIARDNPQAQITLGALAGGGAQETFLYYFLAAFPVFAVWQTAVLAVGVGALNRRISIGKAAAVAFGLWIALALTIAAIRA